MVRGEENGGRLVYMYEPRSTFVSISCCYILVCHNVCLKQSSLNLRDNRTIPSLHGVLSVPMGLMTSF